MSKLDSMSRRQFLGAFGAATVAMAGLGLVGCGGNSAASDAAASVSGTVNCSGATSFQTLVESAAHKFEDKYPDVTIAITGGGSGQGLSDVKDGKAQIGRSDVFAEEKIDAADAAKLQDSLRLCLFHSATIYFVFISGYLFDFVNRRKGQFSPLRFYKSKIVNVFCPYFILSLLLLAAGWISHHWFGYDIPFINDGTPVASLWDVLRCLAYGSASLVPYWYIPFIMTVFSVGPLIFHLPTGLLQKILLPASVLPLMVPRLLVSPLRNLCFFVPIFLMGVYCARNRDACMAFIRRHLSAIRVTAVLTSLLIVADHYFGSFMPNIEGAYYVQKLCIGSWVLELLEGMDREVLALDFLARYSFPLFFLHAIFQGIFQAPLFQVLGAALPGQVFTIANLTVSVEIALCILCILGIKKVMGKRSRYLIGG